MFGGRNALENGALGNSVRVGLQALAFGAVLAMGGCASMLAMRDAVPERLESVVQPVGIDGPIRIWGDQPLTAQQILKVADLERIKAGVLARARAGAPVTSNLLAISGGGDDGAFGAGLLVGWSEHGDRPQFELVTGVSAGALIAPFVFLGKDYDQQLAEVFTRYSGDAIYQANVLSGLLGGPSIASSDPLKELIATYVNRDMLRRIAAERVKGRFLLIGTTNIDAQRPVYWDMGRIAAIGTPEALELFRSVLLASASIPGVFPPVRIRVSADGKDYDELHVDGGTTREVFFSPADFSFKDFDKLSGRTIQRRVFVVRNGKVGAEWQQTDETAVAIGARALSTVLKNQSLGDLDRIYIKARDDGIDYNLAAIPDAFNVPRPSPFDQAYMRALYKVGYRLGKAGYPWLKAPPGASVTSGIAAK